MSKTANKYEVQDKSIEDRFHVLEHEGKEILLLDYTRGSRDACFALTQEFERYIETLQPDGSLRILFDMESPYYDPSHANHWKVNVARYEKYFHSSALINVNAIFQVILKGVRLYAKMVNKPMNEKRGRIFESKAAALEFLSKD